MTRDHHGSRSLPRESVFPKCPAARVRRERAREPPRPRRSAELRNQSDLVLSTIVSTQTDTASSSRCHSASAGSGLMTFRTIGTGLCLLLPVLAWTACSSDSGDDSPSGGSGGATAGSGGGAAGKGAANSAGNGGSGGATAGNPGSETAGEPPVEMAGAGGEAPGAGGEG